MPQLCMWARSRNWKYTDETPYLNSYLRLYDQFNTDFSSSNPRTILEVPRRYLIIYLPAFHYSLRGFDRNQLITPTMWAMPGLVQTMRTSISPLLRHIVLFPFLHLFLSTRVCWGLNLKRVTQWELTTLMLSMMNLWTTSSLYFSWTSKASCHFFLKVSLYQEIYSSSKSSWQRTCLTTSPTC